MSLSQTLSAQCIDSAVLKEIASRIAEKIRRVCSPTQIILFGSAADGDFRTGSDIDLLMVFPCLETLRAARKQIRSIGLLHPTIPIDLLFVSQNQFELKKNLGGVCHIAEHDGVKL